MKNNKHMKKKIDWTIHAVTDVYDDSIVLCGMTNYHTHGLKKYGLTELSVIMDDTYDSNTVASFMNDVAMMMIDGEEFAHDYFHFIDNCEAFPYRFGLKKTTCFGEPTIRLIMFDRNNKLIPSDKNKLALQTMDLFAFYEKLSLTEM